MKIGLIANNNKKESIRNLAIAYRSILMKHELFATGTTGRIIEEATGLNIHKYLEGHVGGEQQLGAQIDANDIDLMIFLCDPMRRATHEPDVQGAIRRCDLHNIPLATNLATAEALLLALDRGDLAWREIAREEGRNR